MTDSWQYKYDTLFGSFFTEKFIEWLNEQGQSGWELVGYEVEESATFMGAYNYRCLFKRKN